MRKKFASDLIAALSIVKVTVFDWNWRFFCSSIKPLKSREEQFKLALDDLARQVRAEREEQSMYEELKKYGNLKKNRSYINHS